MFTCIVNIGVVDIGTACPLSAEVLLMSVHFKQRKEVRMWTVNSFPSPVLV